MALEDTLLLAAAICIAALLYSSVGHAGASGYLAAMALFGMAPEVMKPTALSLNILVASIATVSFYRAGCFSWRTLWPFILGSIPFAFAGGALRLPGHVYKTIVGIILLLAALRLAMPAAKSDKISPKPVPIIPGICWGAGLGLLSGLTGTGGGIFLSPLLLFAGWAETKKSGGVAAAFILANSISGLAGQVTTMAKLPAQLPFWAAAALVGGIVGARLGSRTLTPQKFRLALAFVLLIAGCKMILT